MISPSQSLLLTSYVASHAPLLYH